MVIRKRKASEGREGVKDYANVRRAGSMASVSFAEVVNMRCERCYQCRQLKAGEQQVQNKALYTGHLDDADSRQRTNAVQNTRDDPDQERNIRVRGTVLEDACLFGIKGKIELEWSAVTADESNKVPTFPNIFFFSDHALHVSMFVYMP